MFVKKKPNRSGSTTVTVACKVQKKVKYLKTFGTSCDLVQIERMVSEAEDYIRTQQLQQQPELDFDEAAHRQEEAAITAAENFLSSINSVTLDAPKQILGKVFDRIGFGAIDDDIFRSLVIARLSFPSSKRATVEYLKSYFEEDVSLHKIYRYLDRLNDCRQDIIQKISVAHTMRVHGGQIGALFYDVTTLYFDSDNPDSLRKPGYSKDGKHSNPQIVLGLLVSSDGCPLAYSIHEGSKYEGHTMLPVVKGFVGRYGLEDFVVVADSGMMSDANVADLERNGIQYIIGARIKNMSQLEKEWMLSWEKSTSEIITLPIDGVPGKRLLVGYSEKRAFIDAKNREKGLEKLRKRYASGTITKSKITQRGYNKFLKVSGSEKISVAIDESLVLEDAKWDGLKGYISNAALKDEEIVAAYHELYNVEQSFRIAKSKLEIRPMFHFNEKRIRAHVSICFAALKVYREMDRLLKSNCLKMSVDTVLNIAKTIPTVRMTTDGGTIIKKTLFLTPRQELLLPLFDEEFWGSQK